MPEDSAATNFDFVSDEQFRASLVSDYREIVQCMESGAWKAVHVLSGSVVEAVLVDYLVATDYKARVGKDPLKMDLAEIVEACRNEGILSKKAADLSSVIRQYRNLIHPGRVVRLGEHTDSKTGTVAKALVDIVVDEVVASKKETYGFTAEQILGKILRDSSALSVIALSQRDKRFRENTAATNGSPRTVFSTDGRTGRKFTCAG